MKRIFSFVSRNRKSATRRPSRPRLGVELLESREVPAVIVVNTTDDEVTPGDNKTSLREAIEQANATTAADTIVFARSGQGTIKLGSELNITNDLLISGPGISALTVSGELKSRVFDIAGSGTDVIIRGLTIANGRADASSPVLASHGGGILNYGNLRLTGVAVTDNAVIGDASFDFGSAHGGGVANYGTVAIIGSSFADNSATGASKVTGPSEGVGFPGQGVGGGLFNGAGGSATVLNSHFTGNEAQGGSNCSGTFAGLGQGGAIYSDASLTVTLTSFDGNQARAGDNNSGSAFAGYGIGGAISSGNHTLLSGGTGSAVLAVSFSTFTHNQAIGGTDNTVTMPSPATGPSDALGGAIFVFQGSAAIRFSTVYGNQALGNTGADGVGGSAAGGGILFLNFIGGVTSVVENSVILQNHAIGGPGGQAVGGGIAAGNLGLPDTTAGTFTLRNSLLANNFAKGGDVTNDSDVTNGGNGLGGAVYNDDQKSQAILSGLTMLNNKALGGAGGNGGTTGTGGNGFGGGLFNAGTLTISRSLITRNLAKGGPGGTAGKSLGGGIYSVGAPITLGFATFVFGNTPDQIDD